MTKMMKKLLLAVTVTGMVASADAQTQTSEVNLCETKNSKYEVITNPFWSNWFITLDGGAQMLFSDHDKKASFGKRITPTIDLAVGKWFTPGLGLRAMVSGSAVRGLNARQSKYTYDEGNLVDGKYYKDYWDILNIHGDIMLNLTNMFCGYKENRLYNAIPYVGFGLIHSLDMSSKNNFAVNMGFLNTFRISDKWDFNLEAKALITNDNFDLVRGGVKADIIMGVSAGVTYKFAPRGFRKPCKAAPVKQLISEAELNNLKSSLANQAAENESLRGQLASRPATVEVKEKISTVVAPQAIFFNIGSAKVSPQEEVNIRFLAKQMNQDTTTQYTITGYADSATGSAQLNKELSEKRAQAVIEALVKAGVDRSRLTVASEGGVAMFDKDFLNRAVIVESKK